MTVTAGCPTWAAWPVCGSRSAGAASNAAARAREPVRRMSRECTSRLLVPTPTSSPAQRWLSWRRDLGEGQPGPGARTLPLAEIAPYRNTRRVTAGRHGCVLRHDLRYTI